jgi:hypothetical protein
MFRENVTMEKVTLNQREQNRLHVLNEVNLRKIIIKQAATLMEVLISKGRLIRATSVISYTIAPQSCGLESDSDMKMPWIFRLLSFSGTGI